MCQGARSMSRLHDIKTGTTKKHSLKIKESKPKNTEKTVEELFEKMFGIQ